MGRSEADGRSLVSGARTGSRRRLRAQWCARSRSAGWDPPDDWWTPAVDAVCAAAAAGADMTSDCARFGRARARSGRTIGTALDDFAALCQVLDWDEPPFPLVKALAEGWVDGGRSTEDCQDPLTGLATTAYLRTRLSELYRGAAVSPALTHRMVIVSLDGSADPWRRTAQLIVMGHELRRYFSHGESLALLSRSRMCALAPVDTGLPDRVASIRRDFGREHQAEVWSVPLPATYEHAWEFVSDVGKPPMET
ncbi:hypothetical protein CLV63_112201 [Murinocardiopsis flavida]|uniref:GGDEF domain-containing protein n=1 Tax=Murinocardiopsis flavida TaxID=645275 RepID=A0A2P8DGK1_9ACTN|nr:hypothetical protein [Murinocardiopsis flavida]PSK96316.1 hypothetical protein CLV63_112201 [Murinocardiopsis flavida]